MLNENSEKENNNTVFCFPKPLSVLDCSIKRYYLVDFDYFYNYQRKLIGIVINLERVQKRF